jgi:hypothetical protein
MGLNVDGTSTATTAVKVKAQVTVNRMMRLSATGSRPG